MATEKDTTIFTLADKDTKKKKKSILMQQWKDLKRQHPDALLLFRCGDFYETYNEDATATSEILRITLTKRSVDGAMPMAGFPHHALDTYLPQLIRAGKRVAICDPPLESTNKNTSVKRKVTELVEPMKM